MRLPGSARSHARIRIIWSRGNERMIALCGVPKPMRLFAVTNGKYMQVSSTKRSSAARSTK